MRRETLWCGARGVAALSCDVPDDQIDHQILAMKRQLADAIVVLADRTPYPIAARRLGIDPARMCDLRRGRVARFSVERLVRILATVDRRVMLTVVANSHEEICWFPKIRARRDALRARRRAESRGDG